MGRTIFDKQNELKASAAVTASSDETLILCQPRKMGNRAVVVLNVSAVSGTTPTLAPYINVSPTVGGTKTKVAQLPVINAVGRYEIPLSGRLVEQHVPTAEALGIGWTVGGTTPSFTVQACLVVEN
jgi:hypothetical protein